MGLPILVKQLVDVKLGKYCENRVPEHVRDQIKIIYKIRGDKVTLYESRPFFRDPSKWTETTVAQFRFDKKDNTWSLYCADRNSKWHFYDYTDPTPDLDEMLAAVDEDVTGIFWG
ncbi:MAG: DUF3024 domain-containing protein [Proteobacteria bacterium]|nr:DUF3024 domain-containing protein [Pseudomonadota bacterium]